MEALSVEQKHRRKPRKISENVRELHSALIDVINNDERAFLIQSLNQYQREKNVNNLVVALKLVLNTARKREVYPLLWQIVPHRDREIFHRLWHQGFEDPRRRDTPKSPARSPRNFRPNPYLSLRNNLQSHASDSGIDLPNITQLHSSKNAKYPIKQLAIKRPSNAGFGFSIRGGAEHGVGLYVSSLDEGSVAEKEGLLPGDHIIQVNGTKFDGLTHAQAVKVIQNSKKLNLFVRSVGRVPNSFLAESTCKWVDMRGRRVSPPLGVDSNGGFLSGDGLHKSDLRLLGDDDERKVNIFVEDGAKLGLFIRGGSDYGLGIYIAGVDIDGAAEQAGLKAGDQILDVNGKSFLNISHKQAVKVLKSTKNMIVTLKDVGRLPFTRVTHDKTKWITKSAKNGKINSVPDQVTHITEVEVHSPPGSSQQGHLLPSNRHHTGPGRKGATERSKFHHGIAGSQVLYNGGLPSQKNLIEDQAQQILNENELGTLKYYLEEYSRGFININAFALALFDLLNTPAKMSLMTEIRSSVEPKDIDRFDDLVLKKEIEIMKSGQFLGSYLDDDQHSIHSHVSSVSSLSGKGSSSRSSAKGSFDDTGSRPITPPQIPDVLPPSVKVDDDIKTDTTQPYEVYEATLTFHDDNEQVFDEEEDLGLPTFLTIDPISLDLPRTESTPVPADVDVSSPLLTSSPIIDQNAPIPSTKSVGETTASEPVGDNSRQKKRGKDVLVEGHRETSYSNGKVSSTRPPSCHQQDKKCGVDVHPTHGSQNAKAPPNPFIFPSTFQNNADNPDNVSSISAIFESPVVASRSEVHPELQNGTRGTTPNEEDLRPELGKLPGQRTRLATWAEVQEDQLSLTHENTKLTGSRGSTLTTIGRQKHSSSREQKSVKSHEPVKRNTSQTQNQVSSSSSSSQSSAKNRKSWDGVRNPECPEENQKVSKLVSKDNKERSCSDSNLMNLPKEQQKSIQAKHRASQELYDLHQLCKTKDETNNVAIEPRESPRSGVKEISHSVFEVEVEKSCGGLGLALEGGADTASDIRIKSVKEGNFTAWKCGRLKVGQVVLQVDGTPLSGMTKDKAVLTLRHAYSSSDSPVLKLLIRDV
ncbi:whirlin-like isoform X1 [Montipora capricornis]|uniref:whirlin-like isoform X1 n=1 Tax=Montipora capricornis TaxID=246305 RepID=UPI0035F13B7C